MSTSETFFRRFPSDGTFKVRGHIQACKDWGIFGPNRPLEGLNMGMYCSRKKFQTSEKSISSAIQKSYIATKRKSPLSRSHRVWCLCACEKSSQMAQNDHNSKISRKSMYICMLETPWKFGEKIFTVREVLWPNVLGGTSKIPPVTQDRVHAL